MSLRDLFSRRRDEYVPNWAHHTQAMQVAAADPFSTVPESPLKDYAEGLRQLADFRMRRWLEFHGDLAEEIERDELAAFVAVTVADAFASFMPILEAEIAEIAVEHGVGSEHADCFSVPVRALLSGAFMRILYLAAPFAGVDYDEPYESVRLADMPPLVTTREQG